MQPLCNINPLGCDHCGLSCSSLNLTLYSSGMPTAISNFGLLILKKALDPFLISFFKPLIDPITGHPLTTHEL